MKKFVQMAFSRTALTLAIATVLSVVFASTLFAMTSNLDSDLSSGIVAAESNTIPRDFQAPMIAHSVEGTGADKDLPFPYQITVLTFDSVTSVNLYVVNTLTREVVTTAEHFYSVASLPGAVSFNASGGFIQLVPEQQGTTTGWTWGEVVILLQHGQEVVITTAGATPHPDYDSLGAAGLRDFNVSSILHNDPTYSDPQTPGFDARHAGYEFSFGNSNPDWVNPGMAPPEHFHGSAIATDAAEGFTVITQSLIQQRLRDGEVRVEGVWRGTGVIVQPAVPATATVPLTKVLSVDTTNSITVPNIAFDFVFAPFSFDGHSDAATVAANMPTVDDPRITIPGNIYTASTTTSGTLGVDIPFDRPGRFVFEVKETSSTAVTPLPPGASIDDSPAVYMLIIEVKENNGELVIYSMSIIVDAADSLDTNAASVGATVTALTFTNVLSHDATVQPSEVTTTVALNKVLSVETTTAFDLPNTSFDFAFEDTVTATIVETASVPIPGSTNTTATTANGSTNVDFTFSEAGTFVYEVTELQSTNTLPARTTMNYSDAVYTLTIVVEESNGELVVASVAIAAVTPDASGATDALTFTNILNYVAEEGPIDVPCDECGEYPCVCVTPPPPCDECGEYPCICVTPPPCDVCGEDPCVCVTTPPCDVCGEDPCVCETPPVCNECGEYPCICVTPPPCDVCGEDPCVCITTPPCDECGEYPCVCPPDNGGNGNGGTGQETDDPEETDPGSGEETGTPTPPRRPAGDSNEATTTPGASTGPKTGDWANPTLHLMHMIAAVVLAIVVAYRLACSSETLVRRKSN
ncbi:MAG: hypothetical protein FWC86_04205 [Coriobacteriia bacterium]|nr:hypothetical protein [Coriobacteriia bacterium]